MWVFHRKSLQLGVLSSITIVAMVNVAYVLLRARDPFYPYLLGDVIGSVPYVPYFWGCLGVATLLGAWTLTAFSPMQRASHTLLFERMGRGHKAVIHENQHVVLASMQQVLEELAGQQERYEVLFRELKEEVVQLQGDLDPILQQWTTSAENHPHHTPSVVETITCDSDPSILKGIGPKTAKALQALGVSTIAAFLTSDPVVVAANTYLSAHQVQHLQASAQMLLAPQLTYEDALLVTS